MKSAAISAAFSFVTALGEFCSPPSKTYSSVLPSLAAPRYRNISIDMAGTACHGRASHGVIRKIFGSCMENEYFQFFTDLKVLSRVEAEFAILLRIVRLT